MLIALLFAAQTVAGLPQIKVRPLGGGYVATAKPYPSPSKALVDSEIARRAASLCVGKEVSWGKFETLEKVGKLPLSKPTTVTRDRRQFSCTALQDRALVAAPPGWVASAADDADVRKLFETYYAKRDSGDILGALAMLSPATRTDPAEWGPSVRAFNKELGRGTRKITAVSWEIDPKAADRPGIYAALDFVGVYPSAHFYCGYIGLYRLGPGQYQIVREEQTSFMRGVAKTDPAQVGQLRAAACRE